MLNKVLILSCNTGGGHNAAARAMEEELIRRGIPCTVKDALSFGGKYSSRVASDLYIQTVKYVPKLFGRAYRLGEIISSSKRKSPVYFANVRFAEKLDAYIRAEGFDCVLCTHLYPAETLTWMKKHSGFSVPCWFIGTDYTCIPFTEETRMDGYFIPSPDLIGEYVEKGVPKEKLYPYGIPVSERYCVGAEKAAAREALGLSSGSRIILVMTGSMGFGKPDEMIEALRCCAGMENTRVLVMTGNNKRLCESIAEVFPEGSGITGIPFTDRVPMYMAAADVLITKPGGLTTSEAVNTGIPLILSSPIPGCETCNARFFTERGMSETEGSLADSIKAAIALCDDPERQASMLAEQRKHFSVSPAKRICDFLMNGDVK